MRLLTLAVCSVTLAAAHAGAQCLGDFNSDGKVTVDEVITAVDNALYGCPAYAQCLGDLDRNGRVTMDELVTVVLNALNGCPPPRFVDNGDGTTQDSER